MAYMIKFEEELSKTIKNSFGTFQHYIFYNFNLKEDEKLLLIDLLNNTNSFNDNISSYKYFKNKLNFNKDKVSRIMISLDIKKYIIRKTRYCSVRNKTLSIIHIQLAEILKDYLKQQEDKTEDKVNFEFIKNNPSTESTSNIQNNVLLTNPKSEGIQVDAKPTKELKTEQILNDNIINKQNKNDMYKPMNKKEFKIAVDVELKKEQFQEINNLNDNDKKMFLIEAYNTHMAASTSEILLDIEIVDCVITGFKKFKEMNTSTKINQIDREQLERNFNRSEEDELTTLNDYLSDELVGKRSTLNLVKHSWVQRNEKEIKEFHINFIKTNKSLFKGGKNDEIKVLHLKEIKNVFNL